ncbi:hypothetical protein [Conexibacter sp. CPCC 206217]|uniref:hypothetical protein n=1 Tax=Conexibacter sp. CPCC 206217 TaxID=3064574 RepID=UPI002728EB45|nr:hypothetical protein [Conexibacter sp. CPCC 206217]MDO8209449.1 hypothetical protein [Conexibacter sp. CPCC 206217]
MSQTPTLDPRYVAARRVLLDALDGLAPQLEAIVVVGAQAIYLHGGVDALPLAPFTTDGDLVLDPALLVKEPTLEAAMTARGFRLQEIGGHVEPGIWLASATIEGVEAEIPLDLIVPDGAAPPGGRRGARLPDHGRRAARRIAGLEAALVDHEPMGIRALDPQDARSRMVNVAGHAALLIAKAHKLGEREASGRRDRLDDKDAVDVLRLMLATDSVAVARTCSRLLSDEVAGASTRIGLDHLTRLFGRRGRPGVELATRGVRLAIPAARVEAVCVAYVRALFAAL